jgi:hypothetical protein
MQKLSITCLCAEWCGTCRGWRNDFYGLSERFPGAEFEWLDVEYDAEKVGDVEVESFPTLRIARGETVLFHGVVEPRADALARLIEKIAS